MLLSSFTLESVLARIDLQDAGMTDYDLAEDRALVASILLEEQLPDGSWSRSLLRTAESLLTLRVLLDGMRSSAVDRAIDWLHARAATSDTTPRLFFEAAPAFVDLSELRLESGLLVGSDLDARVAAAALACAALLEWNEDSDTIRAQCAELEVAAHAKSMEDMTLSATALVCATRCLLAAESTAHVDALESIARSQRGDGSWRGVDLFVVLDVLALAVQRKRAPAIVMRALVNAADLLGLMQQPDGRWGRDTSSWQMLAGWRALRCVTPLVAAPAE